MDTPSIVLASGSPRRRELMGLFCSSFSVQPAHTDETLRPGRPLREEIVRLALGKARTVCARLPAGALVVGSDTMVTLDGQALGKPQDAADARRILRLLSGRTHEVLTGLAVVSADGREDIALSVTAVSFYELTEDGIDRYIATGEPMDKAGAYGIQGCGAVLVREIRGDYYSVMGLPVAQLYRILRARGAAVELK